MTRLYLRYEHMELDFLQKFAAAHDGENPGGSEPYSA
jgi:hypothetical protein